MTYMIENRGEFLGKTVFIVIGPLRYTTLDRSRREVAFKDTRLATINQIFSPFWNDMKFLQIKPIICPLFPMNFETYNRSCKRPLHEHFYETWNTTLLRRIIAENKKVVAFNRSNGLPTPRLHKRLFYRENGSYRFEENLLRDGLHVTKTILHDWTKEFKQFIVQCGH